MNDNALEKAARSIEGTVDELIDKIEQLEEDVEDLTDERDELKEKVADLKQQLEAATS